LIDLLSLPAGPKKTALIHMTINLTVVALYVVNTVSRARRRFAPSCARRYIDCGLCSLL
jgi:hypothetical protein